MAAPLAGLEVQAAQDILAAEPGHRLALRVLAHHFREQGDVAQAVHYLTAEANTLPDGWEKADLLYQAARLNDAAGHLDAAIDLYDKARAACVQHAAAEWALWGRLARQQRYADVYRDMLTHPPAEEIIPAEQRAAGELVRAWLAEVHLGDAARAESHYRRAVGLNPKSLIAHYALLGFCRRQKKWADVRTVSAALIEQLAQLPDTELAQAAQHYRDALIAEHFTRERDAALTAYERVVALMPGYTPALEATRELAGALDNHDATTSALQQLIETVADTSEAPEDDAPGIGMWAFALGSHLLAHSENGAESARTWLEQAAALAPAHLPTQMALERCLRGIADASDDQTARTQHANACGQLAAMLADDVSKSYWLWEAGRRLWAIEDARDKALEYIIPAVTDAPPSLARTLGAASAFRGAGLMDECAMIMEAACQISQDQRLTAALHMRLGELYHSVLNKTDKAIEHFRLALQGTPTHLPIILSLSEMYDDAGDAANSVALFEGAGQLLTDSGAQVAVQLRAADIWRHDLRRDDEAFKHFSAALQIDAHNVTAIRGLRQICEDRGAHKNLVDLLAREEQELAAAGDSTQAETGALALLRAEALALVAGKNDGGVQDAYHTFAHRCPDDPYGSECERAVAYRNEQWESYDQWAAHAAGQVGGVAGNLTTRRRAEALFGRQAAAPTPETVALFADTIQHTDLDAPAAIIMLEQFVDAGAWREAVEHAASVADAFPPPVQAVFQWERARLLRDCADGDMAAAQRALEDILTADAHNPDAAEALQFLYYAQADAKSLASLLTRADANGAAGAFSRTALALEEAGRPEHAIDFWSRAAQADPACEIMALRRLEAVYRDLDDKDALLGAYIRHADICDDPATRLRLRLAAGDLHDELGHVEEAVSSYRRVLDDDPRQFLALDKLAALYERLERWGDLVDVLDQRKELLQGADRCAVIERIARIEEDHRGDVPAAAARIEEALGLFPQRLDLLEEASRLYEKAEMWTGLMSALDRRVPLTTDTDALVHVQNQRGHVLADNLDNPEEAIRAYEQARALSPGELVTLVALEILYDKTNQPQELVGVLEKKAERLPNERIPHYLRIGDLWSEKLNDIDQAIASYVRILDIDKKNLDGLRRLDRLYSQLNDFEHLVEIVLLLAEAVSRPEDLEQYLRAATIYRDHLNDLEKALDAARHAVSADESYRPGLQMARELCAAMERWKDVANFYRMEINHAPPADQCHLWAAVGQVFEEKIGHKENAEKSYEKALSINQDYLPAIRPLATMRYEAQQWEKAAPLYHRWANAVDPAQEPGPLAEVLYRKGQVAEHLDSPEASIKDYTRATELAPEYLPPYRALSDLYLRRKDWDKAKAAEQGVLHIVTTTGDAAAQVASTMKLGEIEEHLGNVDGAIERYQGALAVDATHAPALEALVRLHSERDQWDMVLDLLDRVINVTPEGNPRAAAYLRKGEILEDKLDRADEAAQTYEMALAQQPDLLPVHRRIGGAYYTSQRWDEALAALTKHLELEEDPAHLTETRYLLGRTYLDGKHDGDQALPHLQEALKLTPTHIPAMEAVGAVYEEKEDWENLVDVYSRFIKILPPAEATKAITLHLKLGHVYRDHLQDQDRSIQEFQAAVRLEPNTMDAHAALAKIYINDPAMYANAIRENGILLNHDPFRIESYHDLGKIYESQNDVDKAFCTYSALSLLGALDKNEKIFFEARIEHAPETTEKALDADAFERSLLHPAAKSPLCFALPHCASALAAVAGASAADMKRGLTRAGDNDTLRGYAAAIAATLGVEPDAWDLYFSNEVQGVAVRSLSPAAIVINQAAAKGLDSRGQRFLLGRGMALVATGAHALLGLPHQEVQRRIAIMLHLHNESIPIPGADEKQANALGKQLRKALSRKARKTVDPHLAAFYEQRAQWKYPSWSTGVVHSANRAGLLVANSTYSAVAALCLCHKALTQVDLADTQNLPQTLEQSDEVRELLAYSVSDGYFGLRRRTAYSLY